METVSGLALTSLTHISRGHAGRVGSLLVQDREAGLDQRSLLCRVRDMFVKDFEIALLVANDHMRHARVG